MSKRMYAILSDESYDAFMRGEAVDNNGFRSTKGCFYPNQPSFAPINERKEQLLDAGIRLLIAFGGGLVIQVALPEIKRFTHEKVYPCVAEKWDEWQEKHKEKKQIKQISHAFVENQSSDGSDNTEESSSNVINLENYRKEA